MSGDVGVRTIAIAQPTFLPWVGWFDLADQADQLLLLDDVAFSKQSWQQRNRIRTRAGLEFVTVPVHSAGRLGQRIVDTHFVEAGFVDRLLRTLAGSYARAPHWRELREGFEATLRAAAATGLLAELNIGLIEWMAPRLGVTTPCTRTSTLAVEGKRGELVAALCEQAGATRYLSPAGAEDYLLEDRASFERRGIRVELQVYEHPSWRQCFPPFEPYASALDLIFNEGPAAPAILRSGRRPARPLGAGDDSATG